MKKKLIALAFAGASLGLFAGAPSASAAHYCVENPSGVHQTNGNGNRGGEGWRSATPGQERSPSTFDCGTENPPPARVNGR